MYPGIAAADECANFTGAIDQSSASFRFDQQRLNLSIPQAALNSQARGYVSPDKWDAGIPALLMNYSFSGANTEARNNDSKGSDTYYLNLRSGQTWGHGVYVTTLPGTVIAAAMSTGIPSIPICSVTFTY